MTAFYNVRLLDEALDTAGALLVTGGKIRAVLQGYLTNQRTVAQAAQAILAEDGLTDEEVQYVDGKGLLLSPAFIDLHTHLRYPGQEQKEELATGLAAAAAGGYCTVVAMPNTRPVVSNAAAAAKVVEEAARISPVRVIQAVSITRGFGDADTTQLDELDARAVPLISQDGRDVENSAVLLDAMCKAAKIGLVVSCHSEDMALAGTASPLRKAALDAMASCALGPCGTDGFVPPSDAEGEYTDDDDTMILDEDLEGDEEERPEDKVRSKVNALLAAADTMLSLAETVAVSRNILLAQTALCHVHIAHVSTARAMDAVREAKEAMQDTESDDAAGRADMALEAMLTGERFSPENAAGAIPSWSVTCEVTPHHLALCGTDEPFNRAIVNPPLGTEEDRLALLEGLRDGTVDAIATDHAPHTAEDKAAGAAGFVGLETAYAVCNTVLVSQGQVSECRLSQLMSASPARILHLNKGRLAAGYDADLVLLDNEEVWRVDSKCFKSKGRATPFDGMEVTGRVKALYIGGVQCYTQDT